MLLISAAHAGCSQTYPEFSSLRENNRYVVNPESGTVSVFNQDGVLLEKMRSTSAGTPQTEPSVSPAIIHYLLLSKGSISGLVWHDLNGNGNPDENEQGVQDIRVFIDSDNSASYTAGEPYQLTDENGLYTFSRVKPGTNTVSVETDSLPTGYAVITPDPITVNLAPRQVLTDVNFGIHELPGTVTGTIWDQTESVAISGVRVFADLNRDDGFTVGEPVGTTDSAGNYTIANLASGTHEVHVDNATLDVKYHRTPVSGANPTEVTLLAGESMAVDFTYLHKATISGVLRDASGDIWAYVTLFIDLNGNGIYDEGEPITTSNQDGYYIFDDLYPGTYTIIASVPLPDGYDILVSPGTVTVGEGEDLTADFLSQARPVAISGFVWDDRNGNGVQEPDENGFAGVTVFLDSNNNATLDGGEPATTTDNTGAYAFANLDHGNFLIRPDDSDLRHTYNLTTVRNPIYRSIAPGQSYDRARFGYQYKLTPVHSLRNPARINWGADGNLYVADSTNNSVFIYDGALNLQGELQGLATPLGLVADSAGTIYVGNQGRKNVEVYDSAGNLLMAIDDGNIGKPNDLALDRANNLYVLDSNKDAVLIYNREGILQGTIGDSLRIKYGVSIALGYRDDGSGAEIGELYVADQKSCAIHVYSLGEGYPYQKSVGACSPTYTPASWDGLFAGLMAVDIDPFGNIHGLDNNLNMVQVFDPQTGSFLRSYIAYPPENESIVNLQTDIGIQPIDHRVVLSNVATRRIETIATVPAP